ncbi:MAG: cytochrome-c peroxidase, partial [bacterium]|nr:cytochrome-c peroxidase [bacterium]
NAAGQFVQFWDGRAATIEEQAKGPVLNPVEMAMDSAEDAEAVLRAVPEYRQAFSAAFPNEPEPVTFDNMARAIGAFERTLTTPSA